MIEIYNCSEGKSAPPHGYFDIAEEIWNEDMSYARQTGEADMKPGAMYRVNGINGLAARIAWQDTAEGEIAVAAEIAKKESYAAQQKDARTAVESARREKCIALVKAAWNSGERDAANLKDASVWSDTPGVSYHLMSNDIADFIAGQVRRPARCEVVGRIVEKE